MTELFGDQPKETTQPEVKINEDGSVVIGDKFYKDQAALAEAYAHANAHIAQIQSENKAFREKLEGAKSTEEMFAEFDKRLQQPQRQPESNVENTGQEGAKTLSQEEIDALVESKVKAQLEAARGNQEVETRAQKMADNAKKLRNFLIESMGSVEEAQKAWEDYKRSPSYDKELAEQQMFRSPEDLATVILAKAGKPKTVDFSQVPVERRPVTDTPVRTPGWSHYKKLMIEKPSVYWSPSVQQELREATQQWRSAGKNFYEN